MHSKIIKVKSIEDISLINVEVNSYKYSAEIAEFNYAENKKILNQLSQAVLDEPTIVNILYIASLIELLGSKYINTIIRLHKNNFMIDHTEFTNEINKYIDYQHHTGSTYTVVMRKAAKIIEYKYKFEDVNVKV